MAERETAMQIGRKDIHGGALQEGRTKRTRVELSPIAKQTSKLFSQRLVPKCESPTKRGGGNPWTSEDGSRKPTTTHHTFWKTKIHSSEITDTKLLH